MKQADIRTVVAQLQLAAQQLEQNPNPAAQALILSRVGAICTHQSNKIQEELKEFLIV